MKKQFSVALAFLIAAAPIPTPSVIHAEAKTLVSDESEPPSTRLTLGEVLNLDTQPGLTSIVVGKSKQELADEQKAIQVAQEADAKAKASAKKSKINTVAPVAAHVTSEGTVDAQSVAEPLVESAFGANQWEAFSTIVTIESGWNPTARNGKEGACGLMQALPCSKLPQGINTSVEGQIEWGIAYIKARYGTPSAALAFHRIHHWY